MITRRRCDDVEEAFLLASTPAFLARKLEESAFVRQVLGKGSLNALWRLFERAAADAKHSSEGQMLAYSVVVALASRDVTFKSKICKIGSASDLAWLSDVAAAVTRLVTKGSATVSGRATLLQQVNLTLDAKSSFAHDVVRCRLTREATRPSSTHTNFITIAGAKSD